MEKFKFNWPLAGNKLITDFLEKSIANGEVAGTYIFCGPDNIGKATTAVYFAQCLLCFRHSDGGGNLPCRTCPSCRLFPPNPAAAGEPSDSAENTCVHGDCHIIRREKDKKNISVEVVREFIRILGMSSFLNSYKIGIIKDAESLSRGAANALLKTLEEPKDKVVIILITNNLAGLPSTIVSRGRILNFYPVAADVIYDYLIREHQASRSAAKNFSRLCLGRPALAVKFLEDKEFRDIYQKRVKIFFDFLSQDINDRLLAVGDLAGDGGGQETVKSAREILESWQGIVRDCLLLEYGFNDLVRNQLTEEDAAKLKSAFFPGRILELAESLRRAKEYLAANVNPRLVLENVALDV